MPEACPICDKLPDGCPHTSDEKELVKLRRQVVTLTEANAAWQRQSQAYQVEAERLKEEIEALTHEGRQGELEQANVGLAAEVVRYQACLLNDAF